MKRISGLAMSLVVLLGTVACGGEPTEKRSASPPEAPAERVPWAEVVELAHAKEGEYEKVIAAPQEDSVATLLTEWVSFDLRARFIDRAVGTGAGVEATKEDPMLRFLYTEDAFFMWNPGVEEACGTPWVDMPPEAVAATTGISLNPRDLFVIEPLDVVAAAEPPVQATSITKDRTVYEIWVPGMTGIPMSSSLSTKPRMVRELVRQQLKAEVRVPPDGGTWELEVDLTPAFQIIDPEAAGAGTASAIWKITAPKDVPALELPTDVADMKCMG